MSFLSIDMCHLYVCLIVLAIIQGSCCILNIADKSEYSNSKEYISTSEQVPLEDADLNIIQLATKYGYNIEQHTTVTEDGFILAIHRISPKINVAKKNIAVFLMHGALDSSDGWILQGPKNALAYILADEGFDVWMGNARGNKYSQSHTSLTTNSSEYWKFSWDEIGFYDLPIMIDYTLKVTGYRKLYYIGHSQGTTTFYVMGSLRPGYNDKVKMMFSLSPVAWMSNAKSPLLKLFTPTYGIFTYLTSNSFIDYYNKLSDFLCKHFLSACDTFVQQIIGHDYKYFDTSFLKIIFEHVSSLSMRQFLHYGQLYRSGRFCRYDYGEVENLKRYKSKVPPNYDLSRINVPIQLFYSDNDWLSNTTDVGILYSKLPNVTTMYNLKKFNHLDFIYAKTARDLIYKKIIREIEDNESTY